MVKPCLAAVPFAAADGCYYFVCITSISPACC